MNLKDLLTSKTTLTGLVMIGIGASMLFLGIVVPGFESADPGTLITSGLGLIFLRTAVAKGPTA